MKRRMGIIWGMACWASSLWAGALPAPALWTASEGTALPSPEWFKALPDERGGVLGRAVFAISPAEGSSGDCLVTVCFHESQGGFLRVIWEDQAGGAATLSENFYEGIGLPNKRSLVLSRSLVGRGGRLVFQSGTEELGLDKVKAEWLAARAIQVAAGEGLQFRVLQEGGRGLRGEDLHGEAPLPEGDIWQGTVVTAPLLEKAERIEDGVAVFCSLEAAPDLSLLEVEVAGLPLENTLRVWINGHDAGILAPDVPVLQDPGYLKGSDGTVSYAGWRKGRLFLKAGLLQPGENQVLFGPSSDEAFRAPVAIKGLKLQLRYPEERGEEAEISPDATLP